MCITFLAFKKATNVVFHIIFFVGPLVGGMANRFGCRSVCIAGSVVAAAGFALSTVAPNGDVFILVYGVIGGKSYLL